MSGPSHTRTVFCPQRCTPASSRPCAAIRVDIQTPDTKQTLRHFRRASAGARIPGRHSSRRTAPHVHGIHSTTSPAERACGCGPTPLATETAHAAWRRLQRLPMASVQRPSHIEFKLTPPRTPFIRRRPISRGPWTSSLSPFFSFSRVPSRFHLHCPSTSLRH